MQLRASVYYLQAYQIHSEKWDNRIQIFLAITSSSSIGGWVIWNEYGIIWGSLIAVSQVINAIKRFLPLKSKYELEAAERTRAYFEIYIRASTTGES